MLATPPQLEQLPRQTASDVKNRWREVVRGVHESGTVAVTNHAEVELVLMDAETYRELSAAVAALQARERSVLDELSADFDKRLASLQRTEAHRRANAVFSARGKLAKRPKSGSSY